MTTSPSGLHNLAEKLNFEIIPLFPGIMFSKISLNNAGTKTCSHEPYENIMVITYCLSGKIHWYMDNGNQLCLRPGDFSLHTMDICTDSLITVQEENSQSILIYLDLEDFSRNIPHELSGTGITGEFLYEKFCKGNTVTAFSKNETVRNIFLSMLEAPNPLLLAYQKIKVLELLLFLSRLDITPETLLTEYNAEQITLIEAIHDSLITNIDRRISIEMLAKQYHINQTTLKNLFKAVYGTSLAAHIRRHKMEYAAKLLKNTELSIAEIASQIGYDSQSKFTAAFKNCFAALPKEYRKKQLLNKKDL